MNGTADYLRREKIAKSIDLRVGSCEVFNDSTRDGNVIPWQGLSGDN